MLASFWWTPLGPLPLYADVDLSVDEAPLLGRSQHADQFVESSLVSWREFEPRQEIERLAKVPAVVQAARDGRKVLHAGRDGAGPPLEDRPPLVLGERPPRL